MMGGFIADIVITILIAYLRTVTSRNLARVLQLRDTPRDDPRWYAPCQGRTPASSRLPEEWSDVTSQPMGPTEHYGIITAQAESAIAHAEEIIDIYVSIVFCSFFAISPHHQSTPTTRIEHVPI